MIWRILLIVLAIFSVFITDVQTVVFSIMIYAAGFVVASSLNRKNYKTTVLNLYNALFFAGYLYLILCFIYMIQHNHTHLLSYDVAEYFIPQTNDYLSNGPYPEVLRSIWSTYVPFSRDMPGYFTILTFFGKMSELLGSNFYISLQLSSLLAFTLSGIVLFRLFLANGFKVENSFKHTLIIAVFSIIFFYSSQILRDSYVTLFYLSGIYLIFKDRFSIITILKIIAIILITSTFRIESGLFLIILIPAYLLLRLQNSKHKIYVVILSAIIVLVIAVISLRNIELINSIYKFNREVYVEGVEEGDGVLSLLQRIPLIGQLLSIVYTAFQPLPFWSRLYSDSMLLDDHAVYNIMRFPQITASFFNFVVIFYVFVWLLFKKVRVRIKGKISKPLQYGLWIGLVFLLLQSAVVAQRRLMAFYCIYYILFFIIYANLKSGEKRQFNLFSVSLFVLLQIVSSIYIM